MSETVFVLGSSLDPSELHAFCERDSRDATAVRPIGRAYLPDHEPIFTRRELDHGVLVARARRGSAVAGALFEIRDEGALFDAKHEHDGLGTARATHTVLTDDGRVHRASIYGGCIARPGDAYVAPDVQVLGATIRGLLRFGHDPSPIRAAALGRRATTEPSSLFVYGTLRRGESRAEWLDKHDPFEGGKGVVRGTVAGRLVDLGDYPGLVPAQERGDRVHGEVYTFADLDAVFADLDAIEDFHGYAAHPGEYVRSIVRVDLDGRERVAWAYAYLGDVSAHRILDSGDWMRRDASPHAGAPA